MVFISLDEPRTRDWSSDGDINAQGAGVYCSSSSSSSCFLIPILILLFLLLVIILLLCRMKQEKSGLNGKWALFPMVMGLVLILDYGLDFMRKGREGGKDGTNFYVWKRQRRTERNTHLGTKLLPFSLFLLINFVLKRRRRRRRRMNPFLFPTERAS